MELNHYEILGVNQHSTEEEIKVAYKKLAKKYHPDKNPGNSFYEEHFKKINSAYQILSDENKRKNYDLKLHYYQHRKYQPYQSQTSKNPSASTQRPSSRNSSKNKPQPSIDDRKKIRKYTAFTVIGFIIFITCSLFFYKYMNEKTAKERLAEGKIYEGKKQYLNALTLYNEALGYDEEFSEAYIARANIRIIQFNDNMGAIKDYTLAIKFAPQPTYSYYFSRAKCFLKTKNYKEGVNDLSTAININSKIDSLYFYRAEVNNFILKEYNAAIKDYNQLITLNDTFKEGWFGRALAYQNTGMDEPAIQDLNKLISKYPGEGNFYYYRGFSKINLKDSSGACGDWQEAVQHNFTAAHEAMNKYCISHY